MTWGWSALFNVRSHVKQGGSLPLRKGPCSRRERSQGIGRVTDNRQQLIVSR